jgi:hypothetical protein
MIFTMPKLTGDKQREEKLRKRVTSLVAGGADGT